MEDDGVIEAQCILHPKNQEKDEEYEKKEVKEQEENQEGNGISKLGNFISHLVSPKQDQDQEDDDQKKDDKEQEQEQEGNGIKKLGNLISNLVSPKQDKDQDQDKEEGILENIVSHLPTSLPDDAAPTTDEASILIHSIIHD
ncbi:uncharacterized protein [Euphorbia lathyris]|uniref:uncharacterized protein isoform X1 n=1 Tax=Euphorbia lathyris TaxID=212925 RepID=UPI00331355A1